MVDGKMYLKVDGLSKYVYDPVARTLKDLATNKTYSFTTNEYEKVNAFHITDWNVLDNSRVDYVSNNGYIDGHIYKYLLRNHGTIYCARDNINNIKEMKVFGTYIANGGELSFNLK